MENGKKIRELADELKRAADICVKALEHHGIDKNRVLSIGLSADGYMSIHIEDEEWSVIRCAGDGCAILRMEEELPC